MTSIAKNTLGSMVIIHKFKVNTTALCNLFYWHWFFKIKSAISFTDIVIRHGSFYSCFQTREERTLSVFIFKYNFNTEGISNIKSFLFYTYFIKKGLILYLFFDYVVEIITAMLFTHYYHTNAWHIYSPIS